MAWAARDEAGVEEEDEKIEGEALSWLESLTCTSSNDGSWNSSLKVEDLDIPCLLLYAMPQQQPQKRSQNQKPGDSTANQPTLSVFFFLLLVFFFPMVGEPYIILILTIAS